MKQIYSNLCGRWLIPACLSLSCLNVFAQKNNPTALPRGFKEKTTYIVHAPVVLPELLQQHKYEAMKNFFANWATSSIPDESLIFGGKALLAMETGKFSSLQLPCDCLYYLSDYSKALTDIQEGHFKYHMVLSERYTYDGTEDARKTFLFLRWWARTTLNSSRLDSTALFICRVLAGEINDPTTVLKKDPSSCPRISQLQSQLDVYNQKNFMARRDGRRGTASIVVGGWFPTGHLQVLGPHPSVAVQLGWRDKRNEYDITWGFRFLHPTPQQYTFVRNDTIYSSRYYDGGYVGFEYTRYFVHKKYIDLGYTGGIGWDYFSVADGITGEHHDFGTLNVNSFNFNYGLRIKYFLPRGTFIGLTAKYNVLAYSNKGGTDLTGNAFTLDLSFGSH